MVWPPACCWLRLRRRRLKPLQFEETGYWLSQLIPAKLEFRKLDEWRIASAQIDEQQALAATANFGAVDTGLTSDESGHAVAQAEQPAIATAVLAAAELLRSAGGVLPARPGVLLPDIGQKFAELGQDHLTVRHGLLAVPYLWSGKTPRLEEDDRLTLICQLIMLTDAEYEFAVQQGVGKLQDKLSTEGIDPGDWGR